MHAVWANKVEIGTSFSASSWSYKELSDGIESMTPNFNETNNVFHFLSDDGFAQNEVTGMEPTIQVAGRRVVGDDAQDYIVGKQFSLGDDRKSSVKITAEGKVITCACTITDVIGFGGNSTDVNQFGCTLRLNGTPTVTDAV